MSPLIFKIPVLGPIGGVFRTVSKNQLIFPTSFSGPRLEELEPNFPPQNWPKNQLIPGSYFSGSSKFRSLQLDKIKFGKGALCAAAVQCGGGGGSGDGACAISSSYRMEISCGYGASDDPLSSNKV